MIQQWYDILSHKPDDWEYRSIFADWLFEHNNPLEKVQRWLIKHEKHPIDLEIKGKPWLLGRNNTCASKYKKCIVPDDIFYKIKNLKVGILEPYNDTFDTGWLYFTNLIEAEEILSKCI